MSVEHLLTSQERLEDSNLDNYPEALRLRVGQDLIERSKPGIFVYPVYWPVLAFGSELHISDPFITWFVTILFIVASIARYVHMKLLARWSGDKMALWNSLFYLAVLPHGLGWGAMFALSMVLDNLGFAFLMALSTAGFAAGGTFSFAPKKKLSNTFLFSILWPGMIVSVFITHQWIVGILIVTYLVYLNNLVRLQRFEYWRALAIEQQLMKQSRTDALTNLDNRRQFDEKLNELCNIATRKNSHLAILIIDCDHFKNINDTYGHDFGDECLRKIGELLRECLPRSTDTCARYGGEEFSIILPETDVEGAMNVAERIRLAVENMPVEFNGHKVKMTISIGIAVKKLSVDNQYTSTELFKLADKSLYQAKQQGRNCCVLNAE